MKSYLVPSKKLSMDLFNVLQNTIKWIKNRNKNEKYIQEKKREGLINYRKEFCTIHFGLPRRAGNTTLALMIFQNNPGSIFFSYSQDMIECFPVLSEQKNKGRVFTPKMKGYRGLSAPLVIVDEASWVTEKDKESIYAIGCDTFIFIA